ncbi:hypothetical protein HZU40_22390 [Mycolicibacterium fluoranthenivorans]|uniref:Uncharacterized protein n=1 Tax=Mycolicibacterium fluoranthenivorans TaxID=258505 RepID=A0A7G8P9F1_9MYCO|nr:hypothetical protein [Mycolicibacterium fluoranthenivorans]QNJ90967.1 hypothetical protein HZU40_22390 [Mycolicibacterium fluoranthenivorans]
MPQVAPTCQLIRDELRAPLVWMIHPVHGGKGIVTCTGQDDESFNALYVYDLVDRTPAALSAVHAATERQIAAGIRRT